MPSHQAPDDKATVLGSADEALSTAHREVFDALDEAFAVIEMIFDDDGEPVDYCFLEVNRAFADHTGLVDARGKTISEMVPRIEPRWARTYGQVARSRQPLRFVEEAAQMRRWFDVYAWPFGRPESQMVAIHFTDITERKAAEDRLLARSKQFYTLVHKAPIGVTLLDADLRIVEANPTAQTMLGDGRDIVGRDYEAFLGDVWRPDVAAAVAQIARRMVVTGVSYHEPEMAVVHVERGLTEYFDWRMDRVLLPDGLDGIICYFTDVSKQVRARLELTASEQRYRTLFESIEDGFGILDVVVDEKGRPIDYRFAEVNASFALHSGFEEPLGRTITELMPDSEPFWIEAFGAVAVTGEPTRFTTHVASLGRWFDVYAFLVEEDGDRKIAVLFSDMTEQKRAEYALQESVELLRYHAHHDTLTGLPNRLMFEQRLNEAVATADRHGRPFAVLFLDLDNFKPINDDLGHACGDVVLVEIGRRLRRSLRASDVLARIHGDEFVAILPEMSHPHQAGSMAEKLLGVVSAPIEVADTTVRMQASIGVGMYPKDGASARALLRAADTAMYAAKQAGKNGIRYCGASPDDDGE